MPEDTVLDAIDDLWNRFYLARSLFPRMDESMLGVREWSPPGYYAESPYAAVAMRRPVGLDDVDQNNAVAHWINENYIVRLYAILQVFEVPKTERVDLHGYDHYKVVRRLRDKIAHGSSRYNAGRSEDREALERLRLVCKGFTPPDKYGGRFDLSISEVLWPLTLGCREYAATVCGLSRPYGMLEPAPPGHEWIS